MANGKNAQLNREQVLALRGLRLPQMVLKHLHRAGIYCEPAVSIVYRKSKKDYVVRGVESGGAAAQLGAYVSYVGLDGRPLSWIQKVETVGRNGIHAIAIAPAFIRLQVLRIEHTYTLLITRHQFASVRAGKRPGLENTVLFHGIQGTLNRELWGKDRPFAGRVAPIFCSQSGEPLLTPQELFDAVCQLTAAACCIGCRHVHLLQETAPGKQTSGAV